MSVSGAASRRSLLIAIVILPGLAWAVDDTLRKSYVFDSSRDRAPVVTEFPKYPYVARRDRIEGETTVCFTINRRGEVVRPGIRSSTHRIFRRPALKAIRKSTYEPLASGEALSGVKSCRTYRFRLEPVLAENKE